MSEVNGAAHVYIMTHEVRLGLQCRKCERIAWSEENDPVHAADAFYEDGWRASSVCPECAAEEQVI